MNLFGGMCKETDVGAAQKASIGSKTFNRKSPYQPEIGLNSNLGGAR
jgi:hypothetical protein